MDGNENAQGGKFPFGPMREETPMILKRDGKEVTRGSEVDIWGYLHRAHSCSVQWALDNEGYSIEPEPKDNDNGKSE